MSENTENNDLRPADIPVSKNLPEPNTESIDVSGIMENSEAAETVVTDADLAQRRPRKVYSGMWGPLEIGALGVALLVIAGVVLFYVLAVNPANKELQSSKLERDRLQEEYTSAKDRYGDITDTETQVAKLITSVDDFESNYLPVEVTGRTSLYQRINGLITGYGLVNTNGPNYAPLEIADVQQANQSESERGRAKYRSLFPGIYITMTVEGPYQNIRRFIREIETGREFVLISSVELSPSESSGSRNDRSDAGSVAEMQNMPGSTGFNSGQGQAAPPATSRNTGRTQGQIVSLRLEMASYFRRYASADMNTTFDNSNESN